MPRRTRKNIQIVPGGTFGGSFKQAPDLSGFVDALSIFKNDQERKQLEGLSEAERRAAISQVGEFGLDLDRDISAKAAESALAQFISGQVDVDKSEALKLAEDQRLKTAQQKQGEAAAQFLNIEQAKRLGREPTEQVDLPSITGQQLIPTGPREPQELGLDPLINQDPSFQTGQQVVPNELTGIEQLLPFSQPSRETAFRQAFIEQSNLSPENATIAQGSTIVDSLKQVAFDKKVLNADPKLREDPLIKNASSELKDFLVLNALLILPACPLIKTAS